MGHWERELLDVGAFCDVERTPPADGVGAVFDVELKSVRTSKIREGTIQSLRYGVPSNGFRDRRRLIPRVSVVVLAFLEGIYGASPLLSRLEEGGMTSPTDISCDGGAMF